MLFKIDGDEALILELQSNLLNNGISTTDSTTNTSNLSSQSSLIYRLFSGTVNSAYFCDAIPPTSPTVSEEIIASSGNVIVTSIANQDSTVITHKIQLDDVVFVNANGDRIVDLTVNDFGIGYYNR